MSDKNDSLINRLTSKRNSGEITEEEYQELLLKFTKLGLLDSLGIDKDRKNWIISGSETRDGEIVNGSVSVSGKLHVEGSLECERLSVSGSFTSEGNLTVIGKTSVSGRLNVNGTAKFGNKVAASGSVFVDGNLYATDTLSVSGKTDIENTLYSDNITRISGKFSAEQIKSTSQVTISGNINIEKNVISQTLEVFNGKSYIGGDVKAEIIKIGSTAFELNIPNFEAKNITEGIGSITDFVSNVVTGIIPTVLNGLTRSFMTDQPISEIRGDLVGQHIELSFVKIGGNVIGDDIVIGEKVIVEGVINYRNTINLPENHNLKIIKLSKEEEK